MNYTWLFSPSDWDWFAVSLQEADEDHRLHLIGGLDTNVVLSAPIRRQLTSVPLSPSMLILFVFFFFFFEKFHLAVAGERRNKC